MRYFEIDGKPCRALQFDRSLLGGNKDRMMTTNVFVRNIPKELKHSELEQKFAQFGNIKSLKVSLNNDHTSRGYGFIQFNDEEAAASAVQTLQSEKIMQALVFQPRDRRELRRLINNVYFKNLPNGMTESDVRKLFSDFGHIKSVLLLKNEIG